MEPDTSITTTTTTTDSPNAKTSRLQLKWTPEMELVLITSLQSIRNNNNNNNNNHFTMEIYRRVAETMKLHSIQPELCDHVRMKNKLGSLRSDWRSYIELEKLPWKRLPNGVPTDTDEVMEKYYRHADPNARKFRTMRLRHFDKLTDLFDDGKPAVAAAAAAASPFSSSSSSSSMPVVVASASASTSDMAVQLPHSSCAPAITQDQDQDQDQETSYSSPSEELQNLPLPTSGINTSNSHNTPHSHPQQQQQTTNKRPASSNTLLHHPIQPKPFRPPSKHLDKAAATATTETSNLPSGPVGSATAIFTREFRFLPVAARLCVVQRFLHVNVADMWLHTDDEVRSALVKQWVAEAGIET
jgi:hypothetical protein